MDSLNFRVNKKLSTIFLLNLMLAACGGGAADSNSGSPADNQGTVPPPIVANAPTVSLAAGSSSIAYKASTAITWSSTNSSSCTSSGGGGTGTTGSFTTPQLSTTTTYTVTCVGGGKSASGSITVAVAPPIITGFTDAGGGNVTVTSTNTLTNGALITISGTTNYNGTYTVANVTSTSFTIVKAFVANDATGVWQLAGGMVSGCSSTGATGAIALSNVPSRFTGVAPLSVFFDASGTTTNNSVTTQPFHDIEYRWSFGENTTVLASLPGGMNWTYGSTKGSRNLAAGPVAAHVFETPGVYTVALTATDGTNTVSNSCAQIVVQDPNTVFAGANTICVGATSTPVQGQDGCPVGAITVQQSNFASAISSYAKTGKRVLFKHDDTFTGSSTATIAANGPGTIGMYGSGAKPKVQSAATSIITLGATSTVTMQDWRIMDLEIDGQSTKARSGFAVGGNADQVTLLRLNVHDIGDGILLSGPVVEYAKKYNSYNGHMFEQFTLVDSTFNRFLNNYGLFLYANKLAVLGNSVNDSSAAQHITRVPHSAKGVISNNTLSNPALTKQVFTLRSVAYSDINCASSAECIPNLLPFGTYAALTSQTVVSGNHFIGGLSNQPVTIGPSNPDQWDQRFQDIIFERNLYTGASSECCWPMLNIQAQEVTVRNELINMTGAGQHRGIQVNNAGAVAIASDNVRIYNNTIFSNDSSDFTAFRVDSGTTNISVVNNLAYSPNVSGSFFGSGYNYATKVSNNTTSTNTSPLMAVVPPLIPSHFKVTAGSYAIGTGGMVPVLSDFFSVPKTTTRDIGAVIH